MAKHLVWLCRHIAGEAAGFGKKFITTVLLAGFVWAATLGVYALLNSGLILESSEQLLALPTDIDSSRCSDSQLVSVAADIGGIEFEFFTEGEDNPESGPSQGENISTIRIQSGERRLFVRNESGGDTLDLLNFEYAGPLAHTSFDLTRDVSSTSLAGVLDEWLVGDARDKELAPDRNDRRVMSAQFDCLMRQAGLDNIQQDAALVRMVNGPIQFLTVMAFIALLTLLGARYYQGVYTERSVHDEYLKVFKKFGVSANSPSKSSSEKLISAIQDLKYSSAVADRLNGYDSPFMKIVDKTISWRIQNVELMQLPELVAVEAATERRAAENGYQVPRFLIWGIPLVGFVGTIIGVSRSMGAAEGVGNPDEITQILSRSDVTGQIAVAFDTTLVALILSLIGMWILTIVHKAETSWLNEVEEKALGYAAIPTEEAHDKVARENLDAMETSVREVRNEIRKTEAARRAAQSEASSLSAELSLLDSRRDYLESKRQKAEKDVSAIDKQLSEMQQRINNLEMELDEYANRLAGSDDTDVSEKNEKRKD